MPCRTFHGMDATQDAEDGARAIDRDRIAYTIADTARLLSLSVRTVRYLVARGELPSIKVGVARRVHGTAIEAYARKQITAGSEQAS